MSNTDNSVNAAPQSSHTRNGESLWHPTPLEWAETELHYLLAHVIGGDWGKDIEYNDDTFIDVMCIRGTEFRHWDTQHGRTAVPRKIKPSSLASRKLQIGDILVEISGGGPDQPVGRTVLITKKALSNFCDKPAVCTNFLRLARPTKLIASTYLNYYLQYFYKSGEVTKYQGGSNNLRNLKFKEYETITTPLPPLAEQKIIADKLDELLAQVDTLKARLDDIPATLKRFRQSVLAAAVSGKLTEEWRATQKQKSSTEIESIRKKFPSKPPKNDLAKFHAIPAQWSWGLVKEMGVVQLGRQRAPKYHSGNNMRPYLRVANVMEGYISTSDIMEMDFSEPDFTTFKLEAGDILLNEGQSHELVGRPAIFNDEVPNICFTNTLVRFRAHRGVSNVFAYYVFLNNLHKGRFQEIASRTVNISHLGAGRFADMEFPFPPLEEQTEIVRRVEQLFTYADQIEQQVKNAQASVNQLTQSILAKAFRGELTEQWRKDNPDLISGDNSAAALLERIKTERAAAKPAKKTRSRKSHG